MSDSDSCWTSQEHEIQNLKDKYLALRKKVRRLKSDIETLNTKVDWLFMKLKEKDAPPPPPPVPPPPSTSRRWTRRRKQAHTGYGTALALHGGYVHPRPVVQPQPPLPDPPLRMVHAEPPTQAHEQSLHLCVAKGWHTDRFNDWLVRSQENRGDEFQPGDPNSAIGRYVQRLGTCSLPVAVKWEGNSKSAYTVLERAILNRVNEGAAFTCVKVPGKKCSGSTLIGCLRYGASLNLEHGYFGGDGVFDPIVLDSLNAKTRDFWFSDDEQIKLGMQPGTPSAAHMCTERLCDQDVAWNACNLLLDVQDRNGTSHVPFNR